MRVHLLPDTGRAALILGPQPVAGRRVARGTRQQRLVRALPLFTLLSMGIAASRQTQAGDLPRAASTTGQVVLTKKRAQGRTQTLKEAMMAYRKRKGRSERRKGGKEGKTASLHERITLKIVDQLKEGTPPWIKPWSCKGLVGMPRNYVSNRPYSGINVLLTWLSALEHSFKDTRWLTANQISELGGSFEGQKATRIVFAKEYTRKPDTDEEKTFFVHKLYNVFNAEQVTGVDLEPEDPPLPFEARVPELEAFIEAQGVPITFGGDRAFYSPFRDAIVTPHPGNFSTPEAFYAVVLHELAHASGHPNRLNRPKGERESPAYAFEELVAELSAAFLCSEFGLRECVHHAPYLGFYIELLENDPKAIFSASREASRTADFLRSQAADPAPAVAA